MKLNIKKTLNLNDGDINRFIPYSIVCETVEGAKWKTMTRKRRWKKEFSEDERKRCSELYKLSRKWYLKTGIPNEIEIEIGMFNLFLKFGYFCKSL